MNLKGLPLKQRKPPRMTPGNRFNVWKNTKGEWCLGNQCFALKATDDGIQVKMNPNAGKKCPANMQEATNALMDLVREKKPTTFTVPPKGYDDW